jgi:hypothetical protein
MKIPMIVPTILFSASLIGGASAAPDVGFSRSAAGYHLNDNGYRTYYSVAYFVNADCRAHPTTLCRQRLEADSAFCAEWASSGRCGQDAVTLPR